MWWLILVYIAITALVIFCSVVLSSILDQLEKKTRLSSVLLGGLVLAVVTSLPDLFTSLSSVCFLKEPNLAYGGILGANIINIALLAFFIGISTRSFSETKINKRFLITTIVSLIVSIILLLYAFLEKTLTIPTININAISFVIIALYALMLYFNRGEKKANTCQAMPVSRYSVKRLVLFFVLDAILLIICAIGLTYTTNVLAENFMIDKNLAGALFIGLSTSLPEIVTLIVFIRKRNFNLAIGSIVGSIAFNWLILVLSDIFYFDGTVFMYDQSAKLLTSFLTCVLAVATILIGSKCFIKKENSYRWLYFGLAIIVVALAIAYLVIGYYTI